MLHGSYNLRLKAESFFWLPGISLLDLRPCLRRPNCLCLPLGSAAAGSSPYSRSDLTEPIFCRADSAVHLAFAFYRLYLWRVHPFHWICLRESRISGRQRWGFLIVTSL